MIRRYEVPPFEGTAVQDEMLINGGCQASVNQGTMPTILEDGVTPIRGGHQRLAPSSPHVNKQEKAYVSNHYHVLLSVLYLT